jgi:hypothetical protein
MKGFCILHHMRLVLVILAWVWFLGCRAQRIFSFEPDSLGYTGWQILGGRCGITNLKLVGLIPFTATDGNYFMALENDSSAPQPKGSVSAIIALTEMPQSISFDYFYLPYLAKQVGLLQFQFYKNGAEVSAGFDTIRPVFAGRDTIDLQWQRRQFDLPLLTQLPDSCRLQWWADVTTPFSGKPLLLLDNLQWSKWKVGLAEAKANTLKIFPNPASSNFTIGLQGLALEFVSIKNLSGQLEAVWKQPDPTKPIDIQFLNSGIYIIECTTANNLHFSQKLVVCK